MPNQGPALILIAHGTRDPRGSEEMAVLVDQLGGLAGAPVAAAWLEGFAEPDPVDAARQLIDAGAERLVTLPFLVLGAGHAKTDVPEGVAAIRRAFPDVSVKHGRILGLHPALFALARNQVAGVSSKPAAGDEVLLVTGSGSSDPDANGDLAKAARVLGEHTGHRWVEVGYAGVTWPRADDVLRRVRSAGARRVVRFSWSLLAGVLEQRVTAWADAIAAETGLEIVDAGRFGPDPLVADAVFERYREALQGDPRMNCDLCAYRVPLPGLEQRVAAPSAGGTGARVRPTAGGRTLASGPG